MARSIELAVAIHKSKWSSLSQIKKLDCSCEIKEKHEIGAFFGILSLAKDLSVTIRSRVLTDNYGQIKKACRLIPSILWRRPELLMARTYRYLYVVLEYNTECKIHQLAQIPSSFWTGNSLSARNFPYILDPFNNALSALRGPRFEIYIWEKRSKENASEIESEIKASEFFLTSNSAKIITSWPNTLLYELSEPKVVSGKTIFLTGMQISTERNSAGNHDRNLAANLGNFQERDENIETALLIDANLNLYHYLSESLRPLFLALENELPISNIIIRSDLPEQFYEILKKACPAARVVRMRWNETISVQRLWAGVNIKNLSSRDEVFYSENNAKEFLQSDEMRVWKEINRHFKDYPPKKEGTYVSRKRLDSRGIWNANRVEQTFRKHGLQIVDAQSEWNHWERISQSTLLCSSDGAGMANMILLKEGSHVIELIHKRPGWENMAKALGLSYSYVPLRALGIGKLQSILDSFYLDRRGINQILNKATSFTSERNSS